MRRSDEEDDPEPVPTREGYTHWRQLGRGGFGRVYQATHSQRGPVAVKVVDRPKSRAWTSLAWEAKVLAAIGPPAVPAVYEWWEDADRAHLAVELLAGKTWATALAEQPSRHLMKETRRLGLGLLAALRCVHQAGFVHADLKPENVFLTPAGIRLIDLGTARAVAPDVAPMQNRGEVVGTAEYLSPEELRGEDLQPSADIYSFGILLYEILTGHPPFVGAEGEVKEAHLTRRPPRLSLEVPVSDGFEHLVLRCLEKDPRARFADVASLMAALEALGEGPARVVTGAAPAETVREKQTAGVLFFVSDHETPVLSQLLQSFGGELAHSAFEGQAAVFSSQSSDNPLRPAVRAAHALVDRGLAERVVVDLAPVTVRLQGQARRYACALFHQPGSYPAEEEPLGVRITAAGARALDVSESTTTLGREPELDQLMRGAAGAWEGKAPSVLTVLGDPGFGKSHLASVFLEQLRARSEAKSPLRVLRMRATEPAGGVSEPTFRDLLALVLDLPREKPADAGRALLTAQWGFETGSSAWPGIALTLGWLAPDAPEILTLASAPGVLSARASRAVGIRLQALAQASPLLFVLDDAQWADDATLDALEFAALAEAAVPLCVLALARPSFEGRRPEWGMRAARSERIRLQALLFERAEALCRALLLPAEHVPQAIIHRLVERTGRVPLLMVELCRALKAQGMVRQVPGRDDWYIATDELEKTPDLPLVEWVALRELDALPPELAAHARLSALLENAGEDETRGVLEALEEAGEGAAYPLEPSAANDKLVRRGVLVSDGHGHLSFRHALVREAIEKSTPASLREPFHRAAYRFYSKRRSEGDLDVLAKFAHHASKSGQRVEALKGYLELGVRWQSRHAYVAAESMFSRALTHAAEAELRERMTAHHRRGLMRYRTGRFRDSFDDLMVALAGARQLGEDEAALEILLEATTALDWAGDFEQAEKLASEIPEDAPALAKPRLKAHCAMVRGRREVRLARYAPAIPWFEHAVVISAAHGDECYETFVISLLLLGGVHSLMGHTVEATAAFDRLLPVLNEKGDLVHLGTALGNRAFLWAALQDKDRLIEDSRRCIQIAHEIGNGSLELSTHSNLAENLMRFGDLELAAEYARKALDMERKRRGASSRALLDISLARILILTAGGKDAALRLVEALQPEQPRTPEDEIFITAIRLSAKKAPRTEWEDVVRQARASLNTSAMLDVFELYALSALERHEVPQAIAIYEEALAIVETHPSPIAERLRQGLSRAKSRAT